MVVAVRSEKLALSGQMPESTTPMMMFSPALPTPPTCDHRPPGASRPRKLGVEEVSTVNVSSGVTVAIPACVASLAA